MASVSEIISANFTHYVDLFPLAASSGINEDLNTFIEVHDPASPLEKEYPNNASLG
jgi:hypothetical protein